MKQSAKALGIFLAVTAVTVSGYLVYQAPWELGPEIQGFWSSIGLERRPDSDIAASSVPQTVAVSKGNVRQTVIAPGKVTYAETTLLATSVGGQVARVLVRPGDIVHQGDVLAQLDTVPLEAVLAAAHLELQRAEEDYEKRLSRADMAVRMAQLKLKRAEAEHQRQVSEAELNVQIALSQLDRARLQYPAITATEIRLRNAIESEVAAAREYQEAVERRDALWEPPEIAEGYLQRLEAAQDARAIAEADHTAALNSQAANGKSLAILETEVQRAQNALDHLLEGIDPLLTLEVESAQMTRDDLVETGIDPCILNAVEEAMADLEAATVVAPVDGIVLEVQVEAGERVPSGATLFAIAEPSTMEVLSTVIEEDLPLVRAGQQAELFFDAIPDTNVYGRVTHIDPQRIPFEDRPLYQVSIRLGEIPSALASGMSADATIVIRERQDVLRLPRALVRAGIGETTQVAIWADGAIQAREIQLGMRGDTYIEIVGGLSEGDLVVGQ